MEHDRRRLAVLDGLRLCAALAVVSYHYTAFDSGVRRSWGDHPPVEFPLLSKVTSYGWLGVELFFLISGFVICMSCWGKDVEAFFRSRVTRLFPAYWAAVTITFVASRLWWGQYQKTPLADAALNLTMLQEPLGGAAVDGVYWTLWVEATFYLLFTVMVWRGLTLRRVTAFCYLWLLVSVIAVAAKFTLLNLLVVPAWAPYFIAGIALYLIHRFGPDLKLWGLVLVCLVLAVHSVHDLTLVVGKAALHRPLSPWPAVALVVLFFAVMSAIALGWLSRIRWRWLTTAGLLTYPLYLIHETNGWILIHALQPLLPKYVTLGLVVAVMLVAAWLLNRLVERPLGGLLRAGLTPPAPVINQRREADPRDEKRRDDRTRARVPGQIHEQTEVTRPSA